MVEWQYRLNFFTDKFYEIFECDFLDHPVVLEVSSGVTCLDENGEEKNQMVSTITGLKLSIYDDNKKMKGIGFRVGSDKSVQLTVIKDGLDKVCEKLPIGEGTMEWLVKSHRPIFATQADLRKRFWKQLPK